MRVKDPIYTTPPQPYDDITWCELCGHEVYRYNTRDRRDALHAIIMQEAELAATDHFKAKHPWRWLIYERFQWTWVFKRVHT